MKTESFDLMTYVNTDITFRGAILRWSLPGEDRCRQNEVITLEETALTHTPQAHIGILILSSSKGWRPTDRPSSGNHPRGCMASHGRSTSVTSPASNELSGRGWMRRGEITGANLHYRRSAVSPNSKLFFN